ncbi:MAG: CRISPR-associated endonuclease Cas3'' [Scytonematopsis contorta HA4267-MV1]|jgi:CRISPR-associated endonuclease/helicase Cas3|nr:CRISPR-associated endonuclease Cas3'' [Scytonematopsis contorta HA4267-MV1]
MLKHLLAKSYREDGEKLTVEQHLVDTHDAALAIFKGRILINWCRFFRVKDADIFLSHLQIAALFHDIGKANAEFYAAVLKKLKQQTLRHEWLSTFVLHLPSVRSWLENSKLNLDLEVITAAVLSHHLKASYKDWGQPRPTYVKEFQLYLNHPEVTNIFKKIGNIAQIEGLPHDLPDKWVENSFDLPSKIDKNAIEKRLQRLLMKRENESQRLL